MQHTLGKKGYTPCCQQTLSKFHSFFWPCLQCGTVSNTESQGTDVATVTSKAWESPPDAWEDKATQTNCAQGALPVVKLS